MSSDNRGTPATPPWLQSSPTAQPASNPQSADREDDTHEDGTPPPDGRHVDEASAGEPARDDWQVETPRWVNAPWPGEEQPGPDGAVGWPAADPHQGPPPAPGPWGPPSGPGSGPYPPFDQGPQPGFPQPGTPLPGLGKGIEALSRADLTVDIQPATTPVPIQGQDEIGKVCEVFNTVLAQMQGAIVSYNAARAQLGGIVQDVALAARQVQETSTSLAAATQQGGTASGEIAQASERLALGASEASGIVEDLTQKLGDIQDGAARSTLQLENARRDLGLANEAISGVAASAQSMASVAQEGNAAVATTIRAMDRVRTQVETSSQRVSELDEKGRQIGTIVKTIEGIAEQTNLLALNAAIEAARAGEHGRGFAVVADEVRKLAEGASRATREISELVAAVSAGVLQTVGAIQATSDEVAQGAEATDAAGGALAQIVEAARAVALRAEEVAAHSQTVNHAVGQATATAAATQDASESMAAASQAVSSNIANVAATSEETAAGAEELSATIQEIAASAQELSAMSETLDAMMAKFQLPISEAPVGRSKGHLRLAA